MRVGEREEQTGEAARPQCWDFLEKGAVERAPRPGGAGARGRGRTWRGAPTGNGSLCGCDRGVRRDIFGNSRGLRGLCTSLSTLLGT